MKIKGVFILIVMLIASATTFSQDYDFGKVSVQELKQTAHPVEPEADAAILFKEEVAKFKQSESTGWYIETDVFERIKIYNKDGFDYATKMISLHQGNGSNDEDIFGLKASM